MLRLAKTEDGANLLKCIFYLKPVIFIAGFFYICPRIERNYTKGKKHCPRIERNYTKGKKHCPRIERNYTKGKKTARELNEKKILETVETVSVTRIAYPRPRSWAEVKNKNVILSFYSFWADVTLFRECLK